MKTTWQGWLFAGLLSMAILGTISGIGYTAYQPIPVGTAGSANANVLSVQGISGMTKLLVTPDSVALPANQSVNLNQAAGTALDVNSGTKSAGTIRVVLATDQPALTNKLLVTPDSVALPANQSVNVAQIAGAAPSATNPLPVVFPGTLVSGAITSAMSGTTSTSLVGGTASNYLYLTSCQVSNGSTTVSTDILIQDGSGGTTLAVLPAPAATVATTGGGGGAFTFPVPLKGPTAGNAIFAANVTTGSSTKISCQGFRSTVSY